MMKIASSLLLLLLLSSVKAQDCGETKTGECNFVNKICEVVDGTETCTTCLPDDERYIEIFDAICVIPEEIDFDAFQTTLEPFLSFADGAGVCSAAGNTTCDGEFRHCIATDGETDEDGECTACINGYIEYEDECIELDAVNFTAFVETFDPVYVVEPPLTNEERALLIEFLARFISAINALYPPLPYELGLNKFSADTEGEYEKLLGTNIQEGIQDRFPRFDLDSDVLNRRSLQGNLPEKVDWVEAGVMTSVKDQARCGCCWAVSLMAAVEAAAALTPNNAGFLQDLSFQQLISCDEDNLGCNGGNIILGMGYTWLNDFGGVTSLLDYPYTDGGGQTTDECKLDDKNVTVSLQEPKIVVTVNDNLSFEERKDAMKRAVSIQPVTMVLRSNCGTFQSYKKGILTDDGGCACQTTSCIDHAVVIVGYDDTSNPPSWKLRNSWGSGWGEDGYFRIAQEGGGRWGLFGMLAEAVIPLEAFNTTSQRSGAYDISGGGFSWMMGLSMTAGLVMSMVM